MGGVTKDILEIYSRYLSKYPVSGDEGMTLYAPNARESIISNYTLTPALVIFQPGNKVYLNNYYEAIQNQLINWSSDSGPDYKYNYLRNKFAFNDYLKINYPDSKYFFNYTLRTTAEKLYTDYDANEVSADEIYKGKTIAVSGKITKIAKDITDTPYITLDVSEFGEIQCRFEDTKHLKTLSKGDYVTVIGKCAGKMSVVVILSDCVLFEH
ncbi:MAG: hypothetical protein JWQ34_330 [Mucilaginibacter sp.]|nr:hypothetical protein [Mucilaginibacter sp.]